MRLAFLVVVAAGCAASRVQIVPDSDWRTVSPNERDAIDKANAEETSHAQRDVQLATAALDDARRAATETPARPIGRDHFATEQLGRVGLARAEWVRTNLAWREDRLATAFVHLDVVGADREVRRAEVIDQHLRGGDSYDVSAYRGQLARAQERYAAALDRAAKSRAAFVRASADLASQKEAFAQLVRETAPDPSSSPLTLSGWSSRLAEGSHRRGLKIVSEHPHYLKRPSM
jgi:hypothetical protein